MKKHLLFAAFLTASLPAFAAEQTVQGEISDAMCGADHSSMAHDGKKMDARNCTLECTKDGDKFVLVSNGKVYEITNQDLPALKQHAGHKVSVTGDVVDNKITVSKIKM